jgi:hypothetical protein
MVEARMKFDPGMFVDDLVPDIFGRWYLIADTAKTISRQILKVTVK